MSQQITLAAAAVTPAIPATPGYLTRQCARTDAGALGALYFEAYDPGEASATLEEATADIVASFEGIYGELMPEASLVTLHAEQAVAAILTVRRAPWDDIPDCPFIIELFTARAHRRRNLARALVTRCLHEVEQAGASEVALRVNASNERAIALYRSLGFDVWTPP